jgi:hypothetical protein
MLAVAMAVVAGKRGQGRAGVGGCLPFRHCVCRIFRRFRQLSAAPALLHPFLSPSLSSRYFWPHTAFDLGTYAIALFIP